MKLRIATLGWITVFAVCAAGTPGAPAQSPAAEASLCEAAHYGDPPMHPPLRLGAIAFHHKTWEPRVINTTTTTEATLRAVVEGGPTSVELAPRFGGPTVVLTPLGGDVFETVLPVAQLLAGHVAGDLHNFIGFLDVYDGVTRVMRLNTFVNVRTVDVPDVAIVDVEADAQASAHVVNIQHDTPWNSTFPTAAVQRYYELFADDVDFMAVVGNVQPVMNRHYIGARNPTQGIGVPIFDNSAMWGSDSVLQGVVAFPIDHFYDMASPTASHEVGHRWINFLDEHASLALGVPHWPLSELARSIMGYSPLGGQGLTFPFELIDLGNDTWRLQAAARVIEFHGLDLYLMGLLEAGSVGESVVFLNQEQTVQDGAILVGPVDHVDAGDVVAAVGPRLPAPMDAQSHFRVISIVLSAGRLLTAEEMAFFDHLSARGEATTELAYSSGFSSGMTKPFFLASGGRATWSTSVCASEILDGTGNPCSDDDDGDGVLDVDDCAPFDPDTYPGAPEINDGLDNQCPGDRGAGLVDEIAERVVFEGPTDSPRLSWPAQAEALLYQVVRSSSASFADCEVHFTVDTHHDDPATPMIGGLWFYLVRAASPHGGSWGADSHGVERIVPCGDVPPPLPDLIVQSLTHDPINPTTNDPMTFTAVVENVGAAPAGPSTLDFPHGGLWPPGHPNRLFAIPGLAPGATFTVEAHTDPLSAQNYINIVTADVDDDVVESDETNNGASDTYSVTAAQ